MTKNYKSLLFVLCLVLASVKHTTAQQFCGTDLKTRWETPEFYQAYANEVSNANKSTAPYYVPIVFHVVHMGGPENVADTFVHRLLNELNQKFSNTGYYHHASGNAVNIQFCLAEEDPQGAPSTGITRDSNVISNMGQYMLDSNLSTNSQIDTIVASLYGWDQTKYLNIYLVKTALYVSGAVAGFATLPIFHGDIGDGVFLDVDFLNPTVSYYRYDVIGHEVGHYLGLWHTFDGNPCVNNNCMVDGDGVCDTPPATSMVDTCYKNSCNTDTVDASLNNPFRSINLGGLGEQPDDTHNLMDYAFNCAEHFTEGQGDRMVALLTTLRASLLSWGGCTVPASTAILAKESKISIAPNPFNNVINISNSSGKSGHFRLSNMMGVTVFSSDIVAGNSTIQVPDLPAGLYIGEVLTDNSRSVVKLEKTN